MKILFTTPYYPPHFGGVQNYVYNIAKGLSQKYKWEIIVVTTHEKKVRETLNINGIKTIFLPYDFKFSNTPFSFYWINVLREIINIEKPDIINVHTPVPGLGDIANLLKKKIPVVVTYHVLTMKKKTSFFNPFISLYENIFQEYLFKQAKHIICSSQAVKNVLKPRFADKLTVITPGVDLNIFKYYTKDRIQNSILFVANLNKSEFHKGLHQLLDTTQLISKLVPNVLLKIVGDGDFFENYRNIVKAKKLEKNIIFLGKLTVQELIKEYQKANVFCLPAASGSESFGMVIAEAMACGTPVVANCAGGIPYLIKSGVDGILVEPHKNEKLSEEIIKVFNDAKLANRLSKNALKKVQELYTWEQKITETYNMLSKINL